MRFLSAALMIVLVVVGNLSSASAAAVRQRQQVTEAEIREAQEILVDFTLRFAETKDLAPVAKELYFDDFMARYVKSRASNPDFNPAIDVYFAPGLVYDSRLLTTATVADWQRLYLAVNNFLLFGFIRGMKKAPKDADDVKAGDLYPSSVFRLLAKNRNLENMIVRKGAQPPLSTPEEMRDAAATLEQANAILRQESGSKPLLKVNREELAKMLGPDDFFKPQLEVFDETYFEFPKGTRLLFINTPLGLRLMLARDGNKLKIFWTEIIAD
jgi:hypothetical protein